jgi:hypothetical protein
MTIKEKIIAEVDKLADEQLEEVFILLQNYVAAKPTKAGSFLERLSQIQIDGPEDFAANLDQYLSGEKQLDANLH